MTLGEAWTGAVCLYGGSRTEVGMGPKASEPAQRLPLGLVPVVGAASDSGSAWFCGLSSETLHRSRIL